MSASESLEKKVEVLQTLRALVNIAYEREVLISPEAIEEHLKELEDLIRKDAEAQNAREKMLALPAGLWLRKGQTIFAAISNLIGPYLDEDHDMWEGRIAHKLFYISDKELDEALAELEAQKTGGAER